jgi:hypothetical protein
MVYMRKNKFFRPALLLVIWLFMVFSLPLKAEEVYPRSGGYLGLGSNELKPFKTYTNARFGYSIEVPNDLTAQPEAQNGDGRRFTGSYVLTVYASNNILEQTPAQIMQGLAGTAKLNTCALGPKKYAKELTAFWKTSGASWKASASQSGVDEPIIHLCRTFIVEGEGMPDGGLIVTAIVEYHESYDSRADFHQAIRHSIKYLRYAR